MRDDIQNILDYLVDARLAIYANLVSTSGPTVSFHANDPTKAFLLNRADPSLEQYLSWAAAGSYSALLLDGSLLQLTYTITGGRVSSHRLAYVPCPFDIDRSMLEAGDSLVDIVELHLDQPPLLRSPIRFDFDQGAAKPGHPAAHFTINSAHCRIACIAPMHPLRFVDFVFSNFHPDYREAHKTFFASSTNRNLQRAALTDEESKLPHIMWKQDSLRDGP